MSKLWELCANKNGTFALRADSAFYPTLVCTIGQHSDLQKRELYFMSTISLATHRQIPLDLQSFTQFTTAYPGQSYHVHTGWRERYPGVSFPRSSCLDNVSMGVYCLVVGGSCINSPHFRHLFISRAAPTCGNRFQSNFQIPHKIAPSNWQYMREL